MCGHVLVCVCFLSVCVCMVCMGIELKNMHEGNNCECKYSFSISSIIHINNNEWKIFHWILCPTFFVTNPFIFDRERKTHLI